MEMRMFAAAVVYVVGVYLVMVNLAAYAAYGIDKRKARKGRWRISEKTLLLFAVAGGSVGALAGMYTFRHKTRKPKFFIGNWVIFFLQAAAVTWILQQF